MTILHMICRLLMMYISSQRNITYRLNISLYDGYSWSDTTTVDIEFGTNVAPEFRNPSDGSTFSGCGQSNTILINERRALSEYISYYDDPNDDDNNSY